MQGRYVCFYIDKGRYGIILAKVMRIIRYEGITEVPKALPFVEGVINLRGEVIPVINVREKFGLPREVFSKVNRIIVISHKEKNYGLLVDSVRDIYIGTRYYNWLIWSKIEVRIMIRKENDKWTTS